MERERAALEEKERAARIDAETANHLKDQFLATVSHELRAPLNAVLGWAEMLRTGVLDETRRQRAREAVYANARRQAKLIDDLLDVSRIVSGKMQVTRSAVDLAGVVRGALEAVQPAAEAKGIQLETEVDAAAGDAFGDAARLQQILSNLRTARGAGRRSPYDCRSAPRTQTRARVPPRLHTWARPEGPLTVDRSMGSQSSSSRTTGTVANGSPRFCRMPTHRC